MKLTKPLVILDVESTGTDTQKDAVWSFAAVKQMPDDQKFTVGIFIKPWKEIPPDVEVLTGMTNAALADRPTFGEVAKRIFTFMEGCDLCGFGLHHFDVPILFEEFYRCGITWDLSSVNLLDVGVIYKLKEPRDLTSALKFYCHGQEHAGAHEAMADVMATEKVLTGQLEKYPDLATMDLPTLAKYSRTQMDGSYPIDLAGTIVRDKNGVARYTHKKVRGVAVADDQGYAQWMLRNDFSVETHRAITKLLDEINNKGQEELEF
jgi:DNA polymerase III, epsilon subunit and related 3''-5'' exonucleases